MIVLLSILALLIIIIVLVVWLMRRGKENITPMTLEPQTTGRLTPEIHRLPKTPDNNPETEVKTPEIDEKTRKEASLKTLAKSFAERWGSFSNHSDYDNFASLKPSMTPEMQKWADSYLEKEKARIKDFSFYGVITKVLSEKVEGDIKDAAKINLVCQKQESLNNEDIKVSYSDISLGFVQKDGKWLVSEMHMD